MRRHRKKSVRAAADRVDAALDTVALPDPWQIGDYVDAVAAQRGRPIMLHAMPLRASTGLCGLWLALPDRDVIVHETSTVDEHQEVIICHELAHMLLEHTSDTSLTAAELAHQVTGVDMEVVRARGHSNFDRIEELEAELFARKLIARVRDTHDGAPREGKIRRILDSF
ncbi:ImmA/IrrE family metallo-endopeptidase [Skermania sp. ID1734]|uniref:ImmA/IrrE family metallo-endopeptidase n=1 Tax=Skermania sp. ID1734 TaxID=2597516 RepID=UPI00163D6E46|nr:ImmA/IrrE family metallo-endopeptidase [Skermania sp. ID1734]